MIRSVVYTLFGASFTVATAWGLGALLLQRFKLALADMERRLLAFLIGLASLSALVFGFCAIGLARKAVFLVFGAAIISLATIVVRTAPRGLAQPPLPAAWKWLFAGVFTACAALYGWTHIPPQTMHDILMYRLSAIGREHKLMSGAGLPTGFEPAFLFAFMTGRYVSAVLVNFSLLAALALLVFYFGRRLGYPLPGATAAILTYYIAVSGPRDSLAFTEVPAPAALFPLVYLLQVWIGRSLFATAKTCAAQVAKVPWYAWVALICVSPWLSAYADRTRTDKAYFWLEQRWPVESQRHALEHTVPWLCRVGLLGPARIEVQPGVSFLLDPRDLVAVSILRGGSWQPEVWEALAPGLGAGSVFLDVGAHIGYYSMLAAPVVGRTGKVIAFEPNPETLKLLRDNVQANRASNVIVEPIACADRDTMLTLYAAPAMNTGASSLARENANLTDAESPHPYSVRARPIDDVVRELNLQRVDSIKIDVEGAEVMVLRGTLGTLKRFHPKIVVEVVAQQLASLHTTPEDVIAVLREAGYTRSKQVDANDWEWTAP